MTNSKLPEKSEFWSALSARLEATPVGVVAEPARTEILGLLTGDWDQIVKGETAMRAHKLLRAESMLWQTPQLVFEIERHGGAVKGSTRAELQRWVIDVGQATIGEVIIGARQMRPSARSWTKDDATAAANEVAMAIRNGEEHPWIRWTQTGKVQVLTSNILPQGPRRTVEGRRKRLMAELESEMRQMGYAPAGSFWVKEE